MPMPRGITSEDLQRWEERLGQFLVNASGMGFALTENRDHFRPTFYAGEWLFDRLIERDFSEEQAEEQCFAFGQIAASRSKEDPWDIAQVLWENAKAGLLLRPGPKLAALLDGGKSKDDLFEDLVARGITPEVFDRIVDQWRKEKRYPDLPPYTGPLPRLFEQLHEKKFDPEVTERAVSWFRQKWEARQGG